MIELLKRKFAGSMTPEDFDILHRIHRAIDVAKLGWADRADADKIFYLTASGPGAAREALGLANGETKAEQNSADRGGRR